MMELSHVKTLMFLLLKLTVRVDAQACASIKSDILTCTEGVELFFRYVHLVPCNQILPRGVDVKTPPQIKWPRANDVIEYLVMMVDPDEPKPCPLPEVYLFHWITKAAVRLINGYLTYSYPPILDYMEPHTEEYDSEPHRYQVLVYRVSKNVSLSADILNRIKSRFNFSINEILLEFGGGTNNTELLAEYQFLFTSDSSQRPELTTLPDTKVPPHVLSTGSQKRPPPYYTNKNDKITLRSSVIWLHVFVIILVTN